MTIRKLITDEERRARNARYRARYRARHGRTDVVDLGFAYGPSQAVPVPVFAPGAFEALRSAFSRLGV